jgi:hypothetical protein
VVNAEKRRAALGGLAILAGFAVGAIDRRNKSGLGHTAFDVVGLLAWAFVIGGVLAAAFAVTEYRVNRVPASAPPPAAPGWRWRVWTSGAIVFGVAFLFTVAVLVREVVRRSEGDARPSVGAIVITVLLVAGLLSIVRGFRAAGRRARPGPDDPREPG